MDEDTREEWLRDRQDGRVYPLGQALRATFDADNHASLSNDVTGLMIDLSKVPYETGERPPPVKADPPAASALRSSILARVGELFGRR